MLNKWGFFFAYAALFLCVLVFLLDMFTRHFYLMINDALSIAVLCVVLWGLRKLRALKN